MKTILILQPIYIIILQFSVMILYKNTTNYCLCDYQWIVSWVKMVKNNKFEASSSNLGEIKSSFLISYCEFEEERMSLKGIIFDGFYDGTQVIGSYNEGVDVLLAHTSNRKKQQNQTYHIIKKLATTQSGGVFTINNIPIKENCFLIFYDKYNSKSTFMLALPNFK